MHILISIYIYSYVYIIIYNFIYMHMNNIANRAHLFSGMYGFHISYGEIIQLYMGDT